MSSDSQSPMSRAVPWHHRARAQQSIPDPALPYDVLYHVVQDLGESRTTLCNLRLVSKTISQVATKVLFGTITTWLVDYEYARLEQIAGNHELSRLVKKIVFRPWELVEEPSLNTEAYLDAVWSGVSQYSVDLPPPQDLNFQNFQTHMQQRLLAHPESHLNPPHPPNHGPISDIIGFSPEALKRGEAFYRLTCNKYKARCINGYDISDMVSFIRRFVNLSHVKIAPGPVNFFTCRLIRETGISPQLCGMGYGGYAIPLLMKALIRVNPSLRTFEIDADPLGDFLIEVYTIGRLYAFFAEDCAPLDVFRSVQLLNLSGLMSGFSSPEYPYLILHTTEVISRLVGACPNLKWLKVGLHSRSQSQLRLDVLVLNQTMRQLSFLELQYLVLQEEHFVEVLVRHKETLRTLNLLQVKLVEESWLSIVETVHDRLSLRSARLQGLIEYPIMGPEGPCDEDARSIRTNFMRGGEVEDYMCHRTDTNPMTLG